MLAAAVLAKGGRRKSDALCLSRIWTDSDQCPSLNAALVSRQYMDMSRIRIEGLLAAFPKLIGSGKQHTFVETENVRYIYQPMEVGQEIQQPGLWVVPAAAPASLDPRSPGCPLSSVPPQHVHT